MNSKIDYLSKIPKFSSGRTSLEITSATLVGTKNLHSRRCIPHKKNRGACDLTKLLLLACDEIKTQEIDVYKIHFCCTADNFR
jgi:hypothetical protein